MFFFLRIVYPMAQGRNLWKYIYRCMFVCTAMLEEITTVRVAAAVYALSPQSQSSIFE